MKKVIPVVLASFLVVSCAVVDRFKLDSAISQYESVADQVDLGDERDQVLAILLPTQEGIGMSRKKSPEKYIKDDVRVEIYYMRSGRQPDGLTTDDEFVPYLFNDRILVGIGWEVLGGPKSRGQLRHETNINNSTKVIVK